MTVTVTPLTPGGAEVASKPTAIDGAPAALYEGAEKLSVSITGASAKYYLILAQNENAAPTEDNIRYIDQSASAGGEVVFTVYPNGLKTGERYYIFIVGSEGEKTLIASFRYYEPYMRCDVDGSGDIGLNDAVMVLRHLAELDTLEGTGFLAADANKNGVIGLDDAVFILRVIAGLEVL